MFWLVTGAGVRASALFMPKILAVVALIAAAQFVAPQAAQAAPPDVTDVTPASGTAAGGTVVTIHGSNLLNITAVKFGTTDAASFRWGDGDGGGDGTTMQATTPAHVGGTVSVSVTNADGTSVLANAFTFVQTTINSINPNSDYASGGSLVKLVGTGFTGATAVTFGGTAATNFSVVSDTEIRTTVPAHAVGNVDVVVTSPTGASATGASSKFTYLAAPTATTIWKFKGGKDGGRPGPWMVADKAGNLYGVTDIGRTGDLGTVFMLSPPKPPKTAWTHKVLHSFPAGVRPFGSLSIDNTGVLYGSTDRDGANKTGTIFRLRPGGIYEVLYEFPKSNKSPARSVVFGKDGVIFATTPPGLGNSLGEIFSLAPSDTLPLVRTTLHTFKDDAVGGARLLIDKDGNLFANSYFFGASGRGAVYKFVPNGFAKGKFSLIYSFVAAGNDGENPIGGLAMDSDGVIYGATNGGGVGDDGIVFSLTPKSPALAKFTEQKLTTFPGDFGGSNPEAGIAFGKGGVLFGTTREGGSTHRGTVFKVIPPTAGQSEWSYRTVYAFPGDAGGQSPNSDLLIDKKGVIFGTTDSAGSPTCFCGTVFMIKE